MLRPAATLLAGLFALTASAQTPEIRWGRLNDAERQIESWPGDPDAAAVVIGDIGFGEMRLESRGPRYQLRRHRRVKVLSEGGYEQGEVRVVYSGDDRVRRVKGLTFVPDGDDYRRVELDGGDIFDEEVRPGLRELRFSMPALAPGAVFEYEYTFETDNFFSIGWTFQSEEPTLLSEFRYEVPVLFDYVVLSQGNGFEQQETQVQGGRGVDVAKLRWVARDLPALRDEPYTTTEADHVQRLELQLSEFRPEGRFQPERILTSWPEVAQALRDHPSFGRRMERNPRVREVARSVTGTDQEKAQALYDVVRRDYVWDGRWGIFAERDLDDVVETKTGTMAELTFLLLEMYEEAGIPATPVLLSSRSNGRAVQSYPIVSQFDTILALVQVPGQPARMVSPTSPHRAYGDLPVGALNTNAWLLDYDRPRWIEFDAPAGTATTTAIQGTLGADGSLAGTLQLRLTGYDAFDARVQLAAAEAGSASDEAVAEAADTDVEIEVGEVTGVDDPAEPLGVEATFTAPAVEVVDGEMYLTPFVAMQMEENPFERETRLFPVDFAYPSTRTYVASFELPEGWEAVDLPEPVRLVIPSRKVSYQRFVAAEGGRLNVRSVLTIARSQVDAAEYPALRDLYDEVVATEAEAIVIAQLAGPADGVGDAEVREGEVGDGETIDEPADVDEPAAGDGR